MSRTRLVGALLLAVLGATAQAAETVRIELRDGSRLVGEVVAEDERELRIALESGGEVTVPRSSVVSRRSVAGDPAAGGVDPNYSRLMFAPTGRPLRAGEGYFSDYQLLFPGVAYGLTDNVTLAGGMSAIPGLGLDEQLFYVSPKVGFQAGEKLAVAAGGLFATTGETDDAAGIGFAVATWGARRRSVSAGFGYGKAGDTDGMPILMVGGVATVSRRLALVGETWLRLRDTPADEQMFGAAVRMFGERLSADVGVVLVPELLDEGFPIPWVSVTYAFGGR